MPGRLLVVEDDPELRDVIVMALEQEGYAVRSAENGVEAMVSLYLSDGPPDAVVLNLHMPVMSGAELVDVVRHDPRLARIPLVLITGAAVPVDLGRAVDVVLEKPFGLDELSGAVGGLLARGAPPATPPPSTPPYHA
jgi:CheY-like chemotaxis protein